MSISQYIVEVDGIAQPAVAAPVAVDGRVTLDVTVPNGDHIFRVKAIDQSGNEGEYGLPIEGATVAIPGPGDVAGMVFWFEADRVVASDNDPVTSWPDASDNDFDASQATSGNRATYQTNEINGHPCVRFDGTDDWMSCDAPADTKPFTAFALVKRAADGSYTAIISAYDPLFGGADQGMEWRINPTGHQELVQPGVALIGTSTTAIPAGTWVKLAVTYDGSGNYTFYLGGAADGTGTNDHTFVAGAKTAIGAFGLGSVEFFNGDMAVVGKYNSVIAGDDWTLIDGYLDEKYGF